MRSQYWDTWKGIAIIAVIAIHVGVDAGRFPAGSFNWYFGLAHRQLINFAVPFFLALAGFFAVRTTAPLGTTYFRDRLWRVLPPYLFWTLVFVVLKTPEHFLSAGDLFRDFFFGLGIGIGYFVIVLVQYILLTPLIVRLRHDWQHLAVMATLFAGAMIWAYVIRLGFAESALADFPLYALPFFTWYPFYHLGVYVAQRNLAQNPAFARYAWAFLGLAGVFAVAAMAEGVFLANQGLYSFGVSQIKVTSFLTAIALFLFAVAYSHGRTAGAGQPFLAWLGTHSFLIYLSHMLFVTVVLRVLRRVPLVYDFQPLFIIVASALTLGGCIVLVYAAQRVVPVRMRRLLLG